MTDRRPSDDPRADTGSRSLGQIVDALFVDRDAVWALLARGGEDAVEMLYGDHEGPQVPLRICRAVHADGTVVIGEADPEHDALLSQLLRRSLSERG